MPVLRYWDVSSNQYIAIGATGPPGLQGPQGPPGTPGSTVVAYSIGPSSVINIPASSNLMVVQVVGISLVIGHLYKITTFASGLNTGSAAANLTAQLTDNGTMVNTIGITLNAGNNVWLVGGATKMMHGDGNLHTINHQAFVGAGTGANLQYIVNSASIMVEDMGAM